MKLVEKNKIGYFEAILSITLNIILFGLKYWAGIVSASVAIIVDAWHSLSDSFSSIILLFGFKISDKPADKEHPFGHGRAEFISAMIIGTILAVIGVNFLIASIQKFRTREAASFGTFAIIIITVSIILKEIMAQFAIWGGKKTNSKLLLADGWHHRTDAFTSLIILAGIFLGKYYWWVDSALGVLMSLLIFYASYDILKSSTSALIGEEPDQELKNNLIELIKSRIDTPIHLHHLHIHDYGNHKEVTFHIQLHPNMRLREAHKIADCIEKMTRNELKMEATIHLEPFNKKDD